MNFILEVNGSVVDVYDICAFGPACLPLSNVFDAFRLHIWITSNYYEFGLRVNISNTSVQIRHLNQFDINLLDD